MHRLFSAPPTLHVAAVVLSVGLTGCTTLESFLALSDVDFVLERVSGIRLAGVPMDQVRSYSDLSFTDAARIGSALAGRSLPLDLNLHIAADNPEDNPDARLVGMEWTLFLRDRETVGGMMEREVALPAGERTSVSMVVRLDLVEFFEGSASDLVAVASSLATAGGEPAEVRVEIVPSVETPLGPIRYPRPLVLGTRAGTGSSPDEGTDVGRAGSSLR